MSMTPPVLSLIICYNLNVGGYEFEIDAQDTAEKEDSSLTNTK